MMNKFDWTSNEMITEILKRKMSAMRKIDEKFSSIKQFKSFLFS